MSADIVINFDAVTDLLGGVPRFDPSSTIRGSVQIVPHSNVNCRHIYVALVWRTEGRGDRDTGVVSQLDIYQGRLDAGVPTYHDFSFTLPRGPWSYAGHYINIIWQILVTIDVPRAKDIHGGLRFILSPAGRSLSFQAAALR